MPLYEYQCSACGGRFEILQPLGGGSEGLACPGCRSTEVEKVLSTFAAGGQGSGAQSQGAASRGGGCGSGFT
jgi:putative FmdB family regulatory protein